MKQLFLVIRLAIIICPAIAQAGEAKIELKQTIPLPGVEGRIDHFDFDALGERLFVCALGNNSVEVIDLRKGERVHSITGLGAPQGIAYIPELTGSLLPMTRAESLRFSTHQRFSRLEN